jgi:uncharacterized membrane protein
MNQTLPTPIPPAAAWLGYGGLVPFVVLGLASFFDEDRALLWSASLVGYGAAILSFVGALHWGFAMTLNDLSASRRTKCFTWSVVPALLAWLALLLPPLISSILLVTGFLAHYWQDRRLANATRLPAWYLPLRLRLTSVACLCLLLGGFAQRG